MIVISLRKLIDAANNRPLGYLDDVLAQAVKTTENYIVLPVKAYDDLCKKYRDDYVSIYARIEQRLKITEPAESDKNKIAPGAVLLRFLRQLGFAVEPDCPCLKKIRLLDARGVDWALNNSTQVVDWLKEESRRWGAEPDEQFMLNLVQRALAFSRRHEPAQTQHNG